MGAAVVLAALVAAPALGDAGITFQYPSYSPSSVRIAPGQRVTWTAASGNDFDAILGSTHHPLQIVGGALVSSGTTYTQAFAAAGVYQFYCRNHGSYSGGQVSGMSGTVTVTSNTPPTASFTATPATVASGGTVQFDGSGSSDPDVTAGTQTLSYSWDLNGDGVYGDATGPTASMAYTNAGTTPLSVTVRLKVTDSNSDAVGPESSVASKVITVDPPAGTGGGGGTTGGGGGTTGGGGGGAGGGSTAAPPPGTPPGADTSPPLVALATVHPPRARLLGRRGLVVRFTDGEPGAVAATLRAHGLTVAAGAGRIALVGVHALVLHVTRKGLARLRRLPRGRRMTATLTLVATDAAGDRTTLTRRVVIRG